MPTLFVSRQPSTLPSGFETDVEWDSGSSASDTDIGSDALPSPPSSDIDPNTVPRTPSPADPPTVVAIGDWSPASVASSSEKKGAALLPAGTERTLAAEAIPESFWRTLKDASIYNLSIHDWMDDIWSLRQEWLDATPDKFIQKVACSLSEIGAHFDSF